MVLGDNVRKHVTNRCNKLFFSSRFVCLDQTWFVVLAADDLNFIVYSESLTAPKAFQGYQLIIAQSYIETPAFGM